MISLLLFAPWLAVARAVPTCDTSWANPTSGFWYDAVNWTNGVPASMSNVCITVAGTYTVTVRNFAPAAGITLGGATGTQTLLLDGNWSGFLSLSNQGAASDGILSNGKIVLTSPDSPYQLARLSARGVLTNAGEVVAEPGPSFGSELTADLFNNTGTVSVEGPLTASGPWTSSGTIAISPGQEFVRASGSTTWLSGTITNNGTWTQNYFRFTTGSGTLIGNAILSQSAELDLSGTGSANFIVEGRSPLVSDVASGYTITLGHSRPSTLWLGHLDRVNNGTIRLENECSACQSTLDGHNGARLFNNGMISVEPGAGGERYWFGRVINNPGGTIAINESLSASAGPWVNRGTIRVAAGKTLPIDPARGLTLSGGTLTGEGTVQTNVLNSAGSVAPGSSAGTLTVAGNYTQAKKAKLAAEISGPAAGQFDVLDVSGVASLNGTLALAKPFKATLGQTFQILTSGSLTGTFSKETGGIIDNSTGLYYAPTYSSSGVTLEAKRATLDISPASGPPGTSVTVTGSGWLAGEAVVVTFTDRGSRKTIFPPAVADGSGNFSTIITIPADAPSGAGNVSAKSNVTGLTLKRTFTVT